MRVIIVFVVALGVIGASLLWYTHHLSAAESTSRFRTARSLRATCWPRSAPPAPSSRKRSWTWAAQVVGIIEKLGLDPSDPKKEKTITWDSPVEEGTVLAWIDDAVYKAQVGQAKASLLQAKANLLQLQAHEVQAEAEWKRAVQLMPHKAIAQTDYDLDEATYRAAVANVEVGKANIEQCQAALEMAETNLEYCTIKSPVKGVIVDRRVNVGQTAVSTMSAPSLFLIAKDLTRIQVWASVNEADMGASTRELPSRSPAMPFPKRRFTAPSVRFA